MKIKREDGKIVGDFNNGVFVTRRKFKKHYYRVGMGYAISVFVLNQLEAISCHTIIFDELTSVGSRVFHHFHLQDYLDAEEFDKGHGVQKCVPLSDSFRRDKATGLLDW